MSSIDCATELARRTRINRSYLTETLAGKRNIAYLNLRQLAEGLGISLAELLAFHSRRHPRSS